MNRRPSQSRRSYESFKPIQAARFRPSTPDTDFFETRKQKSHLPQVLGALFLAALLIIIGNIIANHFVHVERVSVPVTGLIEKLEGYTLLHISDLKGKSFGNGQSGIRSALKDADFDVVLLTGDMISPLGNAQPFYDLLEVLAELKPRAPIYFIAGDQDPVVTSMDYATGGSPFAPWVLGAQQRGAVLLSSPQKIEDEEQTIWITTSSQLNIDLDTMQPQFETNYLRAHAGGDENEIDLARHNLQWLENTRTARKEMTADDVFITLTHVPPSESDLSAAAGSLLSQIDLILCGHYLGGLTRLPLIGPIFIPSQTLDLYGLFPGADTYNGISRINRTWVYASPGLGASDPLYPAFFFRTFNPPTITLLELTPSSL